jgi:hypothetical protein
MSYMDFLATHPPMFTKAIDMPEADSWLHMTEAKFSLLRYLETQKRYSRPSSLWVYECLVGNLHHHPS